MGFGKIRRIDVFNMVSLLLVISRNFERANVLIVGSPSLVLRRLYDQNIHNDHLFP